MEGGEGGEGEGGGEEGENAGNPAQRANAARDQHINVYPPRCPSPSKKHWENTIMSMHVLFFDIAFFNFSHARETLQKHFST